MAVSTISTPQVKKKTVTLSTNSVGRVSGTTSDLIGVANATIIGVYFERGSFSASRQVSIMMYGNAGYAIEFLDTGTACANTTVSATITYI